MTWLGAALGAVLIGGAAAAAAPLALKQLVDAPPHDTPATLAPLLAYAAAVLIQRACEQIQAYAYGRGELDLTRRFSVLAYEHLLRLPITVHLDHPTGSLTQSVAEGVAGLRLMLAHAVATALPVAAQLWVGAAILGSQLGAAMSAATIGALVVYGAVFALGAWRLGAPMRAVSDGLIKAGGALTEGLINVEALKAFSAERRFAERYDHALMATEGQWRRFLRRRLEAGGVAAVVYTGAIIGCFWLVAAGLEDGRRTPGDLVLVTTFLLQISRPIEMLGFAARDLAQGRAHFAALARLLDLPPEPQAGAPGPGGAGAAALAFEKVSFGFHPGRAVVSDVSFNVPAGGALAIVGKSGAGKSTLVRLALGFYRPDGGRVRLDGQILEDATLPAFRRQIALVGQDPMLMNDSLAANIALGAEDADRATIAEAARQARLAALLAALPEGLDTPVGERGLKLSGGERQRVAMARALLRGARILILDEPTAALDAQTESDLWEAIEALGPTVTKLIVTHRLAAARRAGQILVLDHGRVIECGAHPELMARRGAYWRLWRQQDGGAVEA